MQERRSQAEFCLAYAGRRSELYWRERIAHGRASKECSAQKSPDLLIKVATITGSIFPPPRTGAGIICAVHPTPLSLFPAPKRLGMGIKRRAAFEKTSLMSDKSSVL
jgi:hypothetical protein